MVDSPAEIKPPVDPSATAMLCRRSISFAADGAASDDKRSSILLKILSKCQA
jgi:hypothetical protein